VDLHRFLICIVILKMEQDLHDRKRHDGHDKKFEYKKYIILQIIPLAIMQILFFLVQLMA
jgi:hypothetical protein